MSNSNSIKWKTEDYVKLVIMCALEAIMIGILALVAIAIYYNGLSNVAQLFTENNNIQKFLYMILSLTLLLIILIVCYFYQNRAFIYKTSNIVMLFTIFNISIIICYLFNFANEYVRFLRPYALCALLSLYLIDKKSAMYNNAVFTVMMLLFDSVAISPIFDFDRATVVSLIINFITGTLAIFIMDKEGSRFKVLIVGFIISIPVIVCSICLKLSTSLTSNLILLTSSLASGILTTGLLLILLPFFEFTFSALTNFRLFELTDHNKKLIKELRIHAPGTFNHTLIVSTLAEACASAINENPLLARACAYYHDVGKLSNPEMYSENQADKNPHDELTPELSTDIIRSHAKNGASLILKNHLPQILADTAEQHHGTMPIRFFYMKAQKFTDEKLDIEDFSYYGPKPLTKINAIIMICDASEAVVRTLKDRSHENVDKAVTEVIEERMDYEQFSDCDITFKELDTIRNTIVNNLAGVYHARVKYPKLKVGRKNG